MSTKKSLCYMAPPALVSKCQQRKMVKIVRQSHPHHHSADHDIWQILLILVTAIVNILGSCCNLRFYEYTLTSVRTDFITTLQSTIFKDHIDILHSHYSEWDHELFWLWRLYFHFYNPLEFRNFMNTHWLMFKSGIVTAMQLTIVRVSCSYLSQLLALIRARILLITVSFLTISSWETMHFPWSWSDNIALNVHFRYQYLSWKPYTNSLFEHFWWEYVSFKNVNVTQAVFVATIIWTDWQPSWILIRLLRNNIC